MKPVLQHQGSFRWEGVPVQPYKSEGSHFRDVTRQTLFGPGAGLGCELRYFELAPDGHSSLERHEHPHAVVVVRGAGRVLVGHEVFELRVFDLVRVPPRTWHQFRAASDASLGFLCLVDGERDRPVRPTPEELEALRQRPEVAVFIRA